MSVSGLFITLTVIWCIIHILYHLTKPKNTSLLPTGGLSKSRHINISLKGLHLRISTTKWNVHHDHLTTFLKQGNCVLLVGMYNLGVALGALGMVGAVALCFIGLWHAIGDNVAFGRNEFPSSSLIKRFIGDASQPRIAVNPGQFLTVKPIIPGLTVPLNHLPMILVAVFITQIVHELGHAIAAALESLPILAVGASFTVCIPAAFVTFPIFATNNLNRQSRARVIAAGPFHNLAFWCFLILLSRLGIAKLATVGYKNISSIGKVVVNVDIDSPLYSHLSPGSVITHLDDTPISSLNDLWTSYLTTPQPPPSLGWCVNKNAFGSSNSCCTVPSSSKQTSQECFVSIANSSEHVQGCIDPVPVLTAPTRRSSRCAADAECPSESICAIPHKDNKLMRLTLHPPESFEYETVVLWSGSPEEIFEEVHVGKWLPRVRLFPLWIPRLIRDFWEYLSMATLSLYFFNLLPLPYLDGTELLNIFLDTLFEERRDAFTDDVELLEAQRYTNNTRIREGRWKKRVMKLVHSTLVGSLTLYILLAIMNAWE